MKEGWHIAISVVSTAGGVTRIGAAAIAKLGKNAQRHFTPARVSAAGGKSTKAGVSVPSANVRHIRGCKIAAALAKAGKVSGDAVNTEALRARTVPGTCCYSAADFGGVKKGTTKKGTTKKKAAPKRTAKRSAKRTA